MYEKIAEETSQDQLIVGIDWADKKHDLCIWKNTEQSFKVLPNKHDDIKEFFTELLEQNKFQNFVVIIERTQNYLIKILESLSYIKLFTVHPSTSASYRETFTPSRAKNDPQDAACLVDLYRKHYDKLKLHQVDVKSQVLNTYNHRRRETVDARTKLGQKLTAVLKIFYPQALEIIDGSLNAPIAVDFLKSYPSPQKLLKEDKKIVEQYFNERSSSKSKTIVRMKIIDDLEAVVTDKDLLEMYETEVLDLVDKIENLTQSIKRYEEKIDRKYHQSEDYEIFHSFPGAGEALGPRIMAFFGEDRSLYESVDDVLKASEIAPIKIESGNYKSIRRRYLCDGYTQLTFAEFANHSRKTSKWASAFYEMQKQKGKGHQTVLRALAFKWIRIIFRCWKSHEKYNEEEYLQALWRSKSPLLHFMKENAEAA